MDTDKCYVIDGGLATELERDGCHINYDPLWSARYLKTNPDVIKNAHKRFLESGADVLITSSYQASIQGFSQHANIGEEEAIHLMKLSVKLAKDAREEYEQESKSLFSSRCRPIIAGSVGAYGACLCDGSEYSGNYVDKMTVEELIEWHRPRMIALLEAGVDVLAVETIPAQKEAEAIIHLLEDIEPKAKAWITFSCKDSEHLCHGEKFKDSVEYAMKSPQIIAVGVNCTDPRFVQDLLLRLNKNTGKPFVVYPNSGERWDHGNWLNGDKLPKIGSYVEAWVNAGAKWIGGCCRIFPDDIREIREVMNNMQLIKRD